MLKTTVRGAVIRFALLCVIALSIANVAAAQPEQPDLTIDAATRTQVIDAVLKRLNDSYVFPEVAKKMEQSIRERNRQEGIRSDHERKTVRGYTDEGSTGGQQRQASARPLFTLAHSRARTAT